MKQDRAITAVIGLGVLLAVLMFSVGRFIFGGIILLLAFGVYWNRGGGKFNDRSIYEKIIKTDLSVDEIYEKLKDLDTPFGKPWKAEHKGYPGTSIVFGPGKFRDCVVISRSKKYIDVKHITMLDNIIRSEEDEYRFEDLVNAKEAEVTPERYSIFAGFKLASVMMVKHLAELIEKFAAGGGDVPEYMDFYKFYHHNSSDGYFRDSDGDPVLKVESSRKPFEAKVLDTDGNEMASVIPRAFNKRGETVESAGFDIMANGERYGEIKVFREGKSEGFICTTDDGEFRVEIFPSCLRANVSCNYMISRDGQLKAVVGGSPNLLFENEGYTQNDVILSYDDDYLVLYAMIEIFLLTHNARFLK